MHVMQLVGRYAGQVVDLPYARAKAAVDCGSAEWLPQRPRFHELPFPEVAPAAVPAPEVRRRGRPRKPMLF